MSTHIIITKVLFLFRGLKRVTRGKDARNKIEKDELAASKQELSILRAKKANLTVELELAR